MSEIPSPAASVIEAHLARFEAIAAAAYLGGTLRPFATRADSELEDAGLIEITPHPSGVKLTPTREGSEALAAYRRGVSTP